MGEQGAAPPPLTLRDRCLAAGIASFVSALVVNPLDVVKTRLQAQVVTGLAVTSVPHVSINPQTMQAWTVAGCVDTCKRMAGPGPGSLASAAAAASRLPPVGSGGGALCASHCYVYDSAFDGLVKIVRQEGAMVLWRGTAVSLLMAVPSVGIYLPLYDHLLSTLTARVAAAASPSEQQGQPGAAGAMSPLLPLVAGAAARTITAACTAPLELTRTRLQARLPGAAWRPQEAAAAAAAGARGGGGAAALARLRLGAVAGLWRGLGATLARDVPFSAIYWGTVEPIRGRLLPPALAPGSGGNAGDGAPAAAAKRVLAANVAAGSLAGALAAAVTTPLDVVKTQVQVRAAPPSNGVSAGRARRASSPSTMRMLVDLARTRGAHGLFAGWGARVARTAPSCAIVLSAYEALKAWYGSAASPGAYPASAFVGSEDAVRDAMPQTQCKLERKEEEVERQVLRVEPRAETDWDVWASALGACALHGLHDLAGAAGFQALPFAGWLRACSNPARARRPGACACSARPNWRTRP